MEMGFAAVVKKSRAAVLLNKATGRLDAALCKAAKDGNEGEVASLLKRGAHPGSLGIYGDHVLTLAVESGSAGTVSALLSHGGAALMASELSTRRGREPLLVKAARNGSADVCAALLDAGADIEGKDKEGLTALLNACAFNGNDATAELLLKRGANAKAVSDDGRSALALVARSRRKLTTDLMLSLLNCDADVNAADRNGLTALHCSIMGDNSKATARFLLKAGADADALDGRGLTALHLAALHGSEGALEALLAAGADVNASAVNKDTALHMALREGRRVCVDMLIAAGADLERVGGGRTPLQAVAELGKIEMVRVLLAAGADVSSRTETGLTALALAEGMGHILVAGVLAEEERRVGSNRMKTPSVQGVGAEQRAVSQGGPDALAASRARVQPEEFKMAARILRQGPMVSRLSCEDGSVLLVERGLLDRDGFLELDSSKEGDEVVLTMRGGVVVSAKNESAGAGVSAEPVLSSKRRAP